MCPSNTEESHEAADNSAAVKRDYHCPDCGETKQLSSIGILQTQTHACPTKIEIRSKVMLHASDVRSVRAT